MGIVSVGAAGRVVVYVMEDVSATKVDVLEYASARVKDLKALCGALRSSSSKRADTSSGFVVNQEPKFEYGYDALARCCQRRTTSHRGKRHRRRPNQKRMKRDRAEATSMSKDDPADAGDKKNAAAIPLCRQAKRRLKFQNVSKSVAVSESVRYLETHKWYAKRQKMVQVWNHYLPEGNWGKGLGISSFCAKLSSNFVLHDMSYFWCALVTRTCLLVRTGKEMELRRRRHSSSRQHFTEGTSTQSRFCLLSSSLGDFRAPGAAKTSVPLCCGFIATHIRK